jgi:allophanate hydrolase subunit 1
VGHGVGAAENGAGRAPNTLYTTMPEGIKYAKDFQIPADFPEVLRNLTREILRDQPKDINKYGMCICYDALKAQHMEDMMPLRGLDGNEFIRLLINAVFDCECLHYDEK